MSGKDFFLGGNTPRGFVSFFEELYNPYRTDSAYIIKAGPGTGKSTLMKALARELEEKGAAVERIHCASDPASLDGVLCESPSLCVADGTSPHCLEPKFPGAAENIISLGDFWSEEGLKGEREKIISLTLESSFYHRRSTSYLAAAGNINREKDTLVSGYFLREKAEGFALRLACLEAPKKRGEPFGEKKRRFLSAITGEGTVVLENTVSSLAGRVIGIEDSYSLAGNTLTELVGERAVRNGYEVIFCYCPMRPDCCEHIIIPERSLALVSIRREHPFSLTPDRIIHCSRFYRDGLSGSRQLLRFNRRLCNELILCAVKELKKAKQAHDALEQIYKSAMDYASASAYFKKRLGAYLG